MKDLKGFAGDIGRGGASCGGKPGARTLTERLPASRARGEAAPVQRMTEPTSATAGQGDDPFGLHLLDARAPLPQHCETEGVFGATATEGPTGDQGFAASSVHGTGDGAAVQLDRGNASLAGGPGADPSAHTDDPFGVRLIAAAGVAGPGGPLPHGRAIQASFGRHDLSGVRAHVGSAAAEAADRIGASAYATGTDLAFATDPDLHTAAHEAAHVVQQRHGVHLYGGVGEAGDPYEQHADAVADAVVRGESAEDLLDEVAGGAAGGSVVQRQETGSRTRSSAAAAPSDLGAAARAAIEAANDAYAGLMGGRYPDAAMAHLAETLDAVIEALHRHAGMRSPADEQALIDVKRLTRQVADKLASVFGPHDRRGQPLRERLARLKRTAHAAAFAPEAVELSPTEALEIVDRSVRQLQRAHELTKGFDEVDLHELGQAIGETAKMKTTVAGAPDEASRLGMAISSQQAFLFEVAGELEVVVAAAGGAHGGQIVAAYVHAMALSLGRRDRADRALETARRLRKGQPLAQADDVLDEDDANIAAMRTMDSRSTDLAERAHDKLSKRRAQLERRIARGERVDDLEAPQLLFETREQRFQNQLTVLSLQARQLVAGLDAVDDGVIGTLANGWDKNLPRLINDLRGLDNVIKAARAGYRERVNAAERRDDTGDIDAPRRVLAGKTAALDEMETFLRDWLSTGYFAERTDAAAEALKDAQLALMAVNFAVTVAMIVVGNAAAAAARGLATRAVVSGASRLGIAGARVGQVADTVGAGAAFVADVGVNTAGQRYIQGDDASLASLLAVNVTSPLAIGAISKRFPALRPLSRKDFQGKSLWEKSKLGGGFVLRHGAELSVEMIAGIAIDFANRQAFQQRAAGPLPENTESWILQGASMALGRFIGFRMKARMDAIAHLSQGATARATLESHARSIEESAQRLETSADVEAAIEVLGKYHDYLDQEQGLLAKEMTAHNDGKGTIDRDELFAMMRANSLGRSELGKLGMEELALRAAGLEPQNASGRVWEGRADQIEAARARAAELELPFHVDEDATTGHKTFTIGKRRFEVVESDGGTARAPDRTPGAYDEASDVPARKPFSPDGVAENHKILQDGDPGLNAIVGYVGSETIGRDALRRLSQGDRTALAQLGIPHSEGFNPSSREWALGRQWDGKLVVVAGEPGAVDWSVVQGVTPLGHSHPRDAGRRIYQSGRKLDVKTLVSNDLDGQPGTDAALVFPSPQDIEFMVRRGLRDHFVAVPYEQVAPGEIALVKGVGVTAKGVTFELSGGERSFGDGSPPATAYTVKARMVVGGTSLWSGELTAIFEPNAKPRLSFERMARGGDAARQPNGSVPDRVSSGGAYDPTGRSLKELQADRLPQPQPGESPAEAAARVRAAEGELIGRAPMVMDALGDAPRRIDLRAEDSTFDPEGAHTLENHGADIPLRVADNPGGKSIEGRIDGLPPWPSRVNSSYKWLNDQVMNKVVNDYLQVHWEEIRVDLALNSRHAKAFDAQRKIGEGFFNEGMYGTGPRRAKYSTTSLVRILVVLDGGSPPRYFVYTTFPNALGAEAY